MRVAAYNILHGGEGRLEPITETIVALNADLVVLCEANDPRAVGRIAQCLDADFAIAESVHSPFHVALVSRLPILESINLSAVDHCFGRAAMLAVVDWNDQPLRIAALHLTSGLGRDPEQQRLVEINRVLSMLGGHAMPTILAGDLNTNAPYHPVDIEAAEPEVRSRLKADPTLIAHDVVNLLGERGMIDAHHRCHPNATPHTFTTTHPATRLDYLFVDAHLADRLHDTGVETGGSTPTCSDHFPIWAELRAGS